MNYLNYLAQSSLLLLVLFMHTKGGCSIGLDFTPVSQRNDSDAIPITPIALNNDPAYRASLIAVGPTLVRWDPVALHVSYDEGEQWQQLPHPIQLVNRLGAAVTTASDGNADRLVVAGGYSPTNRAIEDVWIWQLSPVGEFEWVSPTNDHAWDYRPRAGAAIVSAKDVSGAPAMYLLGGVDRDGVVLREVWKSVDRDGQQWSLVGLAPWTRHYHADTTAVISSGGRIVVGKTSTNMDVWISNVGCTSWKLLTVADLTNRAYNRGLHVLANSAATRLYLFGGRRNNADMTDIWISPDDASTWYPMMASSSLPLQDWISIVSINNKLVACDATCSLFWYVHV